MATPGLRFRPPAFPLDDGDLRWVLVRAFAPRDLPVPPPTDAALVVERARGLALAARIGARLRPQVLGAELGAEAAAELIAASRAAAARALQLEGLRHAVLPAARELGIPLVLLKFAALEAAGRLLPGSRSASDLDLLAPVAETPRLLAALRAAGFELGDEPEQEHQWPTLFHRGVALELHRHLPGVVVPSSPGVFATAESLAAAGALVELAPGIHRPSDEGIAAHLLAHGIAQHGLTPEAYPSFRLFADLLDLGLGAAGEARWSAIARWLPRSVSAEEIRATRQLLTALATGKLDDLEGGAATLLRHFLAGSFDPDYRQALKLRLFAPPLSERGRGRAFVAFLRRTVWLTDAQIDDIYGRPASRWGYAARRLARPFDLVGRSLRAVRAASKAGGPKDPRD